MNNINFEITNDDNISLNKSSVLDNAKKDSNEAISLAFHEKYNLIFLLMLGLSLVDKQYIKANNYVRQSFEDLKSYIDLGFKYKIEKEPVNIHYVEHNKDVAYSLCLENIVTCVKDLFYTFDNVRCEDIDFSFIDASDITYIEYIDDMFLMPDELNSGNRPNNSIIYKKFLLMGITDNKIKELIQSAKYLKDQDILRDILKENHQDN